MDNLPPILHILEVVSRCSLLIYMDIYHLYHLYLYFKEYRENIGRNSIYVRARVPRYSCHNSFKKRLEVVKVVNFLYYQ